MTEYKGCSVLAVTLVWDDCMSYKFTNAVHTFELYIHQVFITNTLSSDFVMSISIFTIMLLQWNQPLPALTLPTPCCSFFTMMVARGILQNCYAILACVHFIYLLFIFDMSSIHPTVVLSFIYRQTSSPAPN